MTGDNKYLDNLQVALAVREYMKYTFLNGL